MAARGQISGMRGVYLVAAELARRGFMVSPTSRSAAGADLLVTDQRCKRAYSVQVKTNAKTSSFWLIGKGGKQNVSGSHIYVLVNIRNTKAHGERIEFFVVPSKTFARRAIHEGKWPHIRRDKITDCEGAWDVFGKAEQGAL